MSGTVDSAWEVVIGLEIHAQLRTDSKIFSRASTRFGAEPNTQASAVDLGLPGVLPVPNREVVAHAIRLGTAIEAPIAERSVFARKNYFYPDLPKGYQISQMALPIVGPGHLDVILPDGGTKRVRITRAHLEEDAGKSVHDRVPGCSAIDLNRAGTPLLEIVSEPDMRSAAEATAYARQMHALVRWIGVCDGNMQEGSFRCDANVSIRPRGQQALGTRTEIKNLNSFRFLERAILHEIERQTDLLEDGGRVVQETRLYDPDADETRAMRSKEEANDYRYFPDPDLPPLVVEPAFIARVRDSMPELQAVRRQRFVDALGIAPADAATLTDERAVADWFEDVVAGGAPATLAANWLLGEVFGALNRSGLAFEALPITPQRFAGLMARIDDGTVSGKIAKRVFETMWSGPDTADAIIEREGLTQISDSGAIDALVDQVIAAHPDQVAEFRAGKTKLMGFLVGAAMKASRGKANPGELNAALRRKLAWPAN